MKKCVNVFKMLEMLFEMGYQMGPKSLIVLFIYKKIYQKPILEILYN